VQSALVREPLEVRMLRTLRLFLPAAMLVALFSAPPARAATIALDLWTFGPGSSEPVDTWRLTAATASSADNDGIAGYNIDVVNITSADNLPPLILNGGTPVQGFTVGGSDLSGDGALFAGQDSTIPASVLYHVAEPGFPGPDPTPLTGENVPWGLPPIVLATGTGSWQLVDFGASTNVNVWSEGQAALGGVGAEAATVTVTIHRVVPEPSTALLLAGGLLGLAAAGRVRESR
jgi:hypothetical protein